MPLKNKTMNMKKIFIILLSLILVTSCGKIKDIPSEEPVSISPSREIPTEQKPKDSAPDAPSEETEQPAPTLPDIAKAPSDTDIATVPETNISEQTEPVPQVKEEEISEPQHLPDIPETDDEVEEEPVHSKPEPPAEIKTVSMEVFGLNKEIIFSASAKHREGITVFDLLFEQAREKNIPVVFQGSKSSAYITGINGLCEKANGPESGWIYTVNNKTVMKSCSKCTLNPGDTVQWTYITKFVPLN